jgi:hypothetical protein
VQLRLGRFNRRSAAWRLSGGSSPRKANFLQLVSRAMVGLDLEAVRKITWRFEGYASTVCRATCGRCGADTTQGEHCCCYDRSGLYDASPKIKFGRCMQRVTESRWSMFEELRTLHGDFARESSAVSLHEVSLGGGRGRTAWI